MMTTLINKNTGTKKANMRKEGGSSSKYEWSIIQKAKDVKSLEGPWPLSAPSLPLSLISSYISCPWAHLGLGVEYYMDFAAVLGPSLVI